MLVLSVQCKILSYAQLFGWFFIISHIEFVDHQKHMLMHFFKCLISTHIFCSLRYDYRAGFWGVMGGPCLGIIPVSSRNSDFLFADLIS